MFANFILWALNALSTQTQASTKDRVLLVTDGLNDASSFKDCGAGYFGTYHARQPLSIYIGPSSCNSFESLTSGSLVDLATVSKGQSLVWVEEAAVGGPLREQEPSFQEILDAWINKGSTISNRLGAQMVLNIGTDFNPGILWRSRDAAIIAVQTAQLGTIDMSLPRFWEAIVLPSHPLPEKKLTPESDERLNKIVSKLHFNPDVAAILSSISSAQMYFDIRWLTGETSDSPIVSRHSFSDGSRAAASWIKSKFQDYGAACEYMEFLDGFAPNVICKYVAQPPEALGIQRNNGTSPRIIISAHYDSRGSFGSTRAPGADDDGSGVVQLLAIARAIQKRAVKFNTDVELVAFAGEEQGLLGSHAYAKKLYEEGADIMLMIQADMLAYHSADEPMQLGLPEWIGSPAAAALLSNISSIYVPDLTVGTTSACCSDHQSFWQYGFTATQVFERAGWIIDPHYHSSGDLSNRTNYDLDQVQSIAKVTFASVLHTAGFTFDA